MGEMLIKFMIYNPEGPIEELKKALNALNKNGINYIVLRNYEFLLGNKNEKLSSLDIVLDESDVIKAKKILQPMGFFTERPKSFSSKHIGFSKYLPKYNIGVGFDTQVQNIYWNDMPYLCGRDFFPRKKKMGGFNILSDEDSFIMFVTHSILGKRYFKEKYKHIISDLYKSKLDKDYINRHLYRIFGKKTTNYLIEKISNNDLVSIEKRIKILILKFLIKSPKRPFILAGVTIRWLIWKFRKTPLIAFIGPDGTGKSTTAEAIKAIMENSNRKVERVYLGRGKANLLPLAKPGKIIKEKIKNSAKKYKRFAYSLASFVFTLDLLLRYFIRIRMKRLNGKIVLTDRYATDIYLMPYISNSMRSFLFHIFPKPDVTFYLYNEPKILHERRPKHSIEELKEQLNLFDKMADKLGAVRIKTDNKERVLCEISTYLFDYLNRNGF